MSISPGEGAGYELPLLLLAAFRAVIDEAHEELAARGHPELRPAHGFAMQAIGTFGATAADVGRRLGVSKQAAGKTIDRLAELGYGDWEGSTWKEIEADHPNALATWRADPHGFCPPGGETHLELRRRTAAALIDIIAANTRTVVVSHGVSGAVLRGINLGLDAKAMFVLEKPQDAFFRLSHGAEERILAQGSIDALPVAG